MVSVDLVALFAIAAPHRNPEFEMNPTESEIAPTPDEDWLRPIIMLDGCVYGESNKSLEYI